MFFLFIRQPLIVDGRQKDSSGHFHKQQVVKKCRRQQTASECQKIEIQKENFADNMSVAGQLWKYKQKNNEEIQKIHAFCV